MIFNDLIMHVKNDSLFLNFYTENKEEVLTFVLMKDDFNKSAILDNLYIETIYPGKLGGNLYIDFRVSLFNFLNTIVNDYDCKTPRDLEMLLNRNGLDVEFLDINEKQLYWSTAVKIFNDR